MKNNDGGKRRIFGFDSLRFFAIILIIIYHCFPGFLPGGFIAVEIFFVLSGFLIGAKLIRDSGDHNKSLKGIKGFLFFFWERLKRLFPALLFCLIITLSLAFFANPDLLTSARENSLYAATFSTNIASILTGTSYENSLIPNLFNHTWFLALELQVCLIIYLVFSTFSYFFKQKSSSRKLGFLYILISIFSFILMGLYGGHFGLFDRAYFGPDSHIGAFFLGAAIAAFISTKEVKTPKHRWPWLVYLLLEICIVVAITPFLNYSSSETFVFALPLVTVLSCLMIISILKLQKSKNPKLLKPFEYLGRLSFYLYLFHWPLYILFGDFFSGFLPEFVPYFTILASLILSVLADKIILPFFNKKHFIKYIILALSLILPVLALIKAPENSSIAENIQQEINFSEANSENSNTDDDLEAKFVADYTNISELGNNLVDKIMPYFNDATNFAKVYVAPKPVYNPSANSGYSSGSGFITSYYRTGGFGMRAPYNTPDLSSSSLTALRRLNTMVLGDSVALGAQTNLSSYGYFVDAVGSRNMFDAINLLQRYREANGGNLPHTIVISLVTNYCSFDSGTLQTIVNTAGANHRFLFVTGSNTNVIDRTHQNNMLFNFANSHSNVEVIDWSVVSGSNPSYTYADQIHLTPAGRAAYASVVRNVVGG